MRGARAASPGRTVGGSPALRHGAGERWGAGVSGGTGSLCEPGEVGRNRARRALREGNAREPRSETRGLGGAAGSAV